MGIPGEPGCLHPSPLNTAFNRRQTREALHAYLSGTAPAPGRVPRIAGRFASKRADTADHLDDLLWKDPHS